MTAIVGVLNSQGIAIAADSAVTVSGNNVKKVYNRSNKIFTLSKFHPIGIAIYNSADFMGIPLETLIKMYRKNLKDKAFDTVEEYKNDFITFLKSQLKNVSKEYKVDSFYRFCSWAHARIINNTIEALDEHEADFYTLEQDVRTPIFHDVLTETLNKYAANLDTFDKVSYMDVSFEDYFNQYKEELETIRNYIEEEINKEYEGFTLNDEHFEQIKNLLYQLINIEFIFENYCGLVFIGFGETEIYPSSHHVLVGTSIIDNTRIRMMDVIKINPGVLNSNIIPYAQADVTTTVLTGVDPNYKDEVKKSVKSAFNTASSQISTILEHNDLSRQIDDAMTKISDELIQNLEIYQWTKITGPLLEILAHMGKEDMSELAESLVNITSLKRKFTSSNSSDESVGGPVDVAVISKGDGFIWIKRKHYFDLLHNQPFKDKYFK